MTTPVTPDHLPDLQREVQRLMGQNVLRLQLYEQVLKSILAATDFGMEVPHSGEPRQTQGIPTDGKTLGHLVGQLFGEVLIATPPPAAPDRPDTTDSKASFHAKLQIQISPDELSNLQTALRELVDLRNGLIHHFIDGRDFSTVEGCQAAITDLNQTLEIVGKRLEQLKGLAQQIDGARAQAHATLTSPTMHDFLVKEVIPWEFMDIVADLRDAARELAGNGWTPVNAAASWIKAKDPDQGPEHYNCSTWRHLIHTSGLFDLQYQMLDGRRVGMYRERPRPTPH